MFQLTSVLILTTLTGGEGTFQADFPILCLFAVILFFKLWKCLNINKSIEKNIVNLQHSFQLQQLSAYSQSCFIYPPLLVWSPGLWSFDIWKVFFVFWHSKAPNLESSTHFPKKPGLLLLWLLLLWNGIR